MTNFLLKKHELTYNTEQKLIIVKFLNNNIISLVCNLLGIASNYQDQCCDESELQALIYNRIYTFFFILLIKFTVCRGWLERLAPRSLSSPAIARPDTALLD